MNKIFRLILLYSSLILFLSGCWDQRLLKDVKLLQGVGIDLTEEGQVELTVALQTSTRQTEAEMVPVLSEIGNTVRESRMKMGRRISGHVDTSNNRMIVLQEEIAKENVYAPLDVLYRDPFNPLTTRLAVTPDKAKDLLNVRISDEPFIGQHLNEVIISAEEEGYIPVTSIELFCRDIFDSRADGVLPIIEISHGGVAITLRGLALFHQLRMTGKLNIEESIMLQYLSDPNEGRTGLTLKIDDKPEKLLNYVTIALRDSKRKIKVTVSEDDQIQTNIELNLTAELLEKPDTFYKLDEHVNELNQKISAYLTEQANEVLKALQQANCDALKLGKLINARHPKTWEEIKWEEEFPNINLSADVKLKIHSHGVIE